VPQPITDAQKNGEPFLVWHAGEFQHGWHVAEWSSYVEMWLRRGSSEENYLVVDDVTHWLPLPPDVKS
jgi:hypothetical protein